jgi:tetratricopeptide (TPR) repeat protein
MNGGARWLGWLVLAFAASAPVIASAEAPRRSPRGEARPQRAERAQSLHDEAAELYRRGEYRTAITRLEEALELDPKGKELVYNLALIHERLGDMDLAEAYYRRYLGMEPDAKARERVQGILKRLEGAKREVTAKVAGPPPAAPFPPAQASFPAEPRRTNTPWLIATASVAGTAFVVSGIFAAAAVAKNPGAAASTGNGVSIADLQADARVAHRDAVVSDILFIVGAIAAGSAVYLFVSGKPSRAAPPSAGSALPPDEAKEADAALRSRLLQVAF